MMKVMMDAHFAKLSPDFVKEERHLENSRDTQTNELHTSELNDVGMVTTGM